MSTTTARPAAAADVLAIGFGTTVAMWAVAYVSRLPIVQAPAPLVLVLFLVALLAGGYVAGSRTSRGMGAGLMAGAITGLLNLLVLGSFLSAADRTNGVLPSAAIWVPGSIALSALLAAVGAAEGARRGPRPPGRAWTNSCACVAVAATFLLVIAGGLVTSNKAGLAVTDWPNSYGYNMFLYPFSRMTGGIYYEHAHRLLGALVGLTTMTLAGLLIAVDRRKPVRLMGTAAALLVVIQGILGGLRVTGKPTLGMDTEPNIYLAVVHGVTAQIFLSLLVAIVVVTSPTWISDLSPIATERAARARRGATIAVVAVILQIVFGAIQRHLAMGLMLHIAAALVVAHVTMSAGMRTWGHFSSSPVLRRAGITVIWVVVLQFVLGFAAWVVRGAWESGHVSETVKVTVTTLHQGNGAVLLASVVALRLWLTRLLTPGVTR